MREVCYTSCHVARRSHAFIQRRGKCGGRIHVSFGPIMFVCFIGLLFESAQSTNVQMRATPPDMTEQRKTTASIHLLQPILSVLIFLPVGTTWGWREWADVTMRIWRIGVNTRPRIQFEYRMCFEAYGKASRARAEKDLACVPLPCSSSSSSSSWSWSSP